MKFLSSCIFLFAIKLSNDDVGAARSTVFQEIRPRAGFTTNGDFVKEKLGGATVLRLRPRDLFMH